MLFDGMHATNQLAEAVERELQELRLTASESEAKAAQLEAEIAKLKLQTIESSADRSKLLDLPPLPRVN
ncbi:hypothetical protein AC629_33395 [Bradyrhizobium sp. NAS80.1]|uniref:hypothetical protein n=1 Tax=Bradyrhizobium sp. NAS80.1 TaxID=1680159 RepID=UPI0009646FCE|nr:hypothetical protein [Bradyrhizobium sp. NAS80.1]OKO75940.1 hypothetical protein AC629_33395 [Bradyrhizobium sp. NAS80.1]